MIKNSSPTPAQAEAGNYKMKHIRYNGMDISIENPSGSVRKGTGGDGKEWRSKMYHHYGYIRGTKGRDKDHVDVFINPGTKESAKCFVVNQQNKDGGFDEHKCMLGFNTKKKAQAAYLKNYEKGWKVGPTVEMDIESFKKWVGKGRKMNPAKEMVKEASEYHYFGEEMKKVAKSIYDKDVRYDLEKLHRKGRMLPTTGGVAGFLGGIGLSSLYSKLPFKARAPLGILTTAAAAALGGLGGSFARRAMRDAHILTLPGESEFKKRYVAYRKGTELKNIKSFNKALNDFQETGKPITNPKHREMVKVLYQGKIIQ